jgi:hypothetical protein
MIFITGIHLGQTKVLSQNKSLGLPQTKLTTTNQVSFYAVPLGK